MSADGTYAVSFVQKEVCLQLVYYTWHGVVSQTGLMLHHCCRTTLLGGTESADMALRQVNQVQTSFSTLVDEEANSAKVAS